jgi:hypothetical protein
MCVLHMVQHTVVGVEGTTVPDATPPDGAQDPPVAVVPVVIAALSPAPEHAAGADCGIGIMPPLQFGSPKLETVAEHWMPVGDSHVQALQARESAYEA